MGQQGALQSNDQHKGDITTWHFIYLDTFYSEERDYVPEIYNIENLTKRKKGEDSVHIVSQRNSHRVPL